MRTESCAVDGKLFVILPLIDLQNGHMGNAAKEEDSKENRVDWDIWYD